MRHSTLKVAALGALAVLSALVPITTLQGQRPLSLGVAGGIAVPQGRFGDRVDAGWHALGTIALVAQMQPLGLRLDAAYSQFDFAGTAAGGATIGDGAQRTVSVTLNPTYRLPMTSSPISPYLIAGAGAYNLGCSGDRSCDAVTRFGWNAGLGAKLAGLGLRSFVEARYHRVALPGGGVHYFPLTLGLLF